MSGTAGAEGRIAQAAAIADGHLGDAAVTPASQEGAPDPGTSAAGTVAPVATPAPVADQGADLPFNIADVPDGVREHVERYNKQLQGAFTQKTQELSQLRQPIESTLQLLERANGEDPADRIAALNELLDPYGIEIPDDEEFEEVTPPAVTEATPGTPTMELPPELKQGLDFLLTREQQRQAQEATDQQQAFKTSVSKSVEDAVTGFAKKAGYPDDVAVPQHVRDGIIDRAIALPKLSDGMPDMAGAIAAYEAAEAAIVQAYVQKKGLNPPTPDLSGSAGRAQVDLSDPKQRLAAAEAVAARHL